MTLDVFKIYEKICLEKTQASILEYIQLNFLKNCVNLAVISNTILKDVKINQDYSTSNSTSYLSFINVCCP